MNTEPFVIADEYTKHLPARAVAKLEKWINRGGDLSGFWHYLLSGDYGSAACNADPELLASFGWLLRFLEQSAPSDSFGSPEAVKNWLGLVDQWSIGKFPLEQSAVEFQRELRDEEP